MNVILEEESIFSYYPKLKNELVTDTEKAQQTLKEAIREFRRMKRNDLIADAYYYMAETHFKVGDAKKMISNALNGIGYVKQSQGIEKLLPKLYNVAGVGYSLAGEYGPSQQYYLEGLKYAELLKDDKVKLSVENNIGSLFLQLGDYKEALQYASKFYTEALRGMYDPEFTSLPLSERTDREDMFYIAILNMADIAYHESDYETSLRYLDQIESLPSKKERHYFDGRMCTIKTKDCLCCGEVEDAKEQIALLLKQIDKDNSSRENVELFEDLREITAISIEQGEQDMAWSVLELMLEVCKALDNTNRWTMYYNLLVEYYKEWGEERDYLIACTQYHKFASKNGEEFNRSILVGIKNRLEIEKSMQRQKAQEERAEEMRLLSETDELTQLLNRRSFNRLSQKYFEGAIQSKSTFGLIMMDVDFFKQYNDHYGHLAGDRCLQTVAGILKENDNEGYLSSRYGGDEFIVIARNKTSEEIYGHMLKILEMVRQTGMEHCESQAAKIVTVTLGAANIVPDNRQTVADLLQMADDALYEAKKNGKNQVYMKPNRED